MKDVYTVVLWSPFCRRSLQKYASLNEHTFHCQYNSVASAEIVIFESVFNFRLVSK